MCGLYIDVPLNRVWFCLSESGEQRPQISVSVWNRMSFLPIQTLEED